MVTTFYIVATQSLKRAMTALVSRSLFALSFRSAERPLPQFPQDGLILENLTDGEVDALHAVQDGEVNVLHLDMGEAVLACRTSSSPCSPSFVSHCRSMRPCELVHQRLHGVCRAPCVVVCSSKLPVPMLSQCFSLSP